MIFYHTPTTYFLLAFAKVLKGASFSISAVGHDPSINGTFPNMSEVAAEKPLFRP